MINKRIEILTEELSMKYFLEGLIPRLLIDDFKLNVNCFIYHHQGKSDLLKKLPRRIRAYRHYPEAVSVLVVQDQDSSDCLKLKNKLKELIVEQDTSINYLIRIACRELENWYLGDLVAVEKLYPKSKATKHINKAKFRNPDNLFGSDEMKKITDEFTKLKCAREIAPIISLENNNSLSFNVFKSGLQNLFT